MRSADGIQLELFPRQNRPPTLREFAEFLVDGQQVLQQASKAMEPLLQPFIRLEQEIQAAQQRRIAA